MTTKQNDIEELFRTHYAAMYRLAYTLLHNREESRDVVQEVFARLLSRKERSLPTDIGSNFLLIATRNGCLNIIARRSREERMQRLYPRETAPSLVPVEEQQERWAAINRYIDEQLPPQTRRILRLCYDEGKSYQATAALLGISTSAVNKHIVQGLRKLREQFAPEMPATPRTTPKK